jgi:CDP-glucose 4,6-dehydratase
LDWKPQWDASEAIKRVCNWHKAYMNGDDMKAYTLSEIDQHQVSALKV